MLLFPSPSEEAGTNASGRSAITRPKFTASTTGSATATVTRDVTLTEVRKGTSQKTESESETSARNVRSESDVSVSCWRIVSKMFRVRIVYYIYEVRIVL